MVNTFVWVCVYLSIVNPSGNGGILLYLLLFLHFLQPSGRPNPAESRFVICSQRMDTNYAQEYLFDWLLG